MINWILENKEWIFSGIGVMIITFVITLILNKKKENSISQNITNGENNSQVINNPNNIDSINQNISGGSRNSQTIDTINN